MATLSALATLSNVRLVQGLEPSCCVLRGAVAARRAKPCHAELRSLCERVGLASSKSSLQTRDFVMDLLEKRDLAYSSLAEVENSIRSSELVSLTSLQMNVDLAKDQGQKSLSHSKEEQALEAIDAAIASMTNAKQGMDHVAWRMKYTKAKLRTVRPHT